MRFHRLTLVLLSLTLGGCSLSDEPYSFKNERQKNTQCNGLRLDVEKVDEDQLDSLFNCLSANGEFSEISTWWNPDSSYKSLLRVVSTSFQKEILSTSEKRSETEFMFDQLKKDQTQQDTFGSTHPLLTNQKLLGLLRKLLVTGVEKAPHETRLALQSLSRLLQDSRYFQHIEIFSSLLSLQSQFDFFHEIANWKKENPKEFDLWVNSWMQIILEVSKDENAEKIEKFFDSFSRQKIQKLWEDFLEPKKRVEIAYALSTLSHSNYKNLYASFYEISKPLPCFDQKNIKPLEFLESEIKNSPSLEAFLTRKVPACSFASIQVCGVSEQFQSHAEYLYQWTLRDESAKLWIEFYLAMPKSVQEIVLSHIESGNFGFSTNMQTVLSGVLQNEKQSLDFLTFLFAFEPKNLESLSFFFENSKEFHSWMKVLSTLDQEDWNVFFDELFLISTKNNLFSGWLKKMDLGLRKRSYDPLLRLSSRVLEEVSSSQKNLQSLKEGLQSELWLEVEAWIVKRSTSEKMAKDLEVFWEPFRPLIKSVPVKTMVSSLRLQDEFRHPSTRRNNTSLVKSKCDFLFQKKNATTSFWNSEVLDFFQTCFVMKEPVQKNLRSQPSLFPKSNFTELEKRSFFESLFYQEGILQKTSDLIQTKLLRKFSAWWEKYLSPEQKNIGIVALQSFSSYLDGSFLKKSSPLLEWVLKKSQKPQKLEEISFFDDQFQKDFFSLFKYFENERFWKFLIQYLQYESKKDPKFSEKLIGLIEYKKQVLIYHEDEDRFHEKTLNGLEMLAMIVTEADFDLLRQGNFSVRFMRRISDSWKNVERKDLPNFLPDKKWVSEDEAVKEIEDFLDLSKKSFFIHDKGFVKNPFVKRAHQARVFHLTQVVPLLRETLPDGHRSEIRDSYRMIRSLLTFMRYSLENDYDAIQFVPRSAHLGVMTGLSQIINESDDPQNQIKNFIDWSHDLKSYEEILQKFFIQKSSQEASLTLLKLLQSKDFRGSFYDLLQFSSKNRLAETLRIRMIQFLPLNHKAYLSLEDVDWKQSEELWDILEQKPDAKKLVIKLLHDENLWKHLTPFAKTFLQESFPSPISEQDSNMLISLLLELPDQPWWPGLEREARLWMERGEMKQWFENKEQKFDDLSDYLERFIESLETDFGQELRRILNSFDRP